jgi:protein TonB
MLAYAANRPAAGKRQPSPNALLIVISVHVALLAVVMSAKMDLPSRIHEPLTTIQLLSQPAPPPPDQTRTRPRVQHTPARTAIDKGVPVISTANLTGAQPEPTMPLNFGTLLGTSKSTAGPAGQVPPPAAIRHEARLLTPSSELKPPYPASKLASEEEGVLTLRLSIDERGRVVAVDPIGVADRAFLESARHYLIAHWRYQPATEGDRPVSSTVTITLHFRLDS